MAITKQMYVKMETLVGGTTAVYFASGTLSGLTDDGTTASTVFNTLQLIGMARGSQTVDPLTGANTFPPFTFNVLDDKPGSGGTYEATDTGRIMKLFYTNRKWMYQTLITVWEGDSATAYGSFTKGYSGYLNNLTREAGGYTCELLPLLDRLKNPVIFPTGSFQVATAFDYNIIGNTAATSIYLKNGVNLIPTTVRTNFLESAAWTQTGMTGSPGSTLNTPMNGAGTSFVDIPIGVSSTNAKLGVCYTYWASIPNVAQTNSDTLQVKVDGYNGGTLVDSFASQIVTCDGTGFVGRAYAVVSYVVTDPNITKLRLTVNLDENFGAAAGVNVILNFSVSNSWLLGRELVDILSYNSANGKTTMLRGMLGSISTYHNTDEQGIRVTILAGHPNDIARRLMLTTGTAGGGGKYDPGDGLGLGASIPLTLMGTTWDSERTATDSGNLFTGYDFSKYKMLFMVADKIPDVLAWIQKEICQAVHANIFMSYTGLLDIHYWRSSETAGATTLTDSTLVIPATMEIVPTENRNSVINQITYRMDHDLLAACSIQGNQRGGSSNLLREFVFTEPSFGEDSTTASSAALFGVRELVIESLGFRGAYSTRFGYCYALGGDQSVYETARRIMTRHRLPVTSYDGISAFFSKRAIQVADIIPVTCAVMPNPAAGVWGRTAAKMTPFDNSFDYDTGEATLSLTAIQDIIAIPDTTPANDAAPATPADAVLVSIIRDATLAAAQQQNLPIYPKDVANLITVTITVQTYDVLVYALNGTAGVYATDGGDAALQLVGEILAGATTLYYLTIGNVGGTTYTYVKIAGRMVNRRAESAKNTNNKNMSLTGAFTGWGNRGPKLEIRQLSGANEGLQTGPGLSTYSR